MGDKAGRETVYKLAHRTDKAKLSSRSESTILTVVQSLRNHETQVVLFPPPFSLAAPRPYLFMKAINATFSEMAGYTFGVMRH
jgi:hypothetical protein